MTLPEGGPWKQTPKPIISNDLLVSVHTHSGVLLYQYNPGQYYDLKFSRELREVSKCDVTFALDGERPNIVPWAHWLIVWSGDGSQVLWRGPIQKTTATRSTASIAAKDTAALMARTRNPLTKDWEGIDPCEPAAEMWERLIDLHGLDVEPIVRHDPDGDHFDWTITQDVAMMDATFGDLTTLGLSWTVVAGVPLLGPRDKDPIATLGENDFIGESVELSRDGAATYNDVLVRGPGNLGQARVEMHGQNLQHIVTVESMFGVSNVDRAAQQYVRYSGAVRETVTLPSGSKLHPHAPVLLEQLIPSTRFIVDAYGIRTLMELEQMEVTLSAEDAAVTVKMESVLELPELLDQKATGTGKEQL
jgi:hypothetical protein